MSSIVDGMSKIKNRLRRQINKRRFPKRVLAEAYQKYNPDSEDNPQRPHFFDNQVELEIPPGARPGDRIPIQVRSYITNDEQYLKTQILSY